MTFENTTDYSTAPRTASYMRSTHLNSPNSPRVRPIRFFVSAPFAHSSSRHCWSDSDLLHALYSLIHGLISRAGEPPSFQLEMEALWGLLR